MVEDVEVPDGVCVRVIDHDVHDSDPEPNLSIWGGVVEENPLLIAAKEVVGRIREAHFFTKTFLEDTGILEAIAEAERMEVDDDG
jgi:hypothetical protein